MYKLKQLIKGVTTSEFINTTKMVNSLCIEQSRFLTYAFGLIEYMAKFIKMATGRLVFASFSMSTLRR